MDVAPEVAGRSGAFAIPKPYHVGKDSTRSLMRPLFLKAGYTNMPKGNPDPSPETRFEAGRSGNPGGKTSAQRQAEVDAAEKAALIQKAMLDALADEVAADPENALAAIKGDPLKLIKDAMDRAYGTAVQKVASTSPDGETSSVDWDLLTLEQKKAVLAARKENESDPNEG